MPLHAVAALTLRPRSISLSPMIERIMWPEPQRGEPECPFLRGAGERSLRLTFHSATLTNLPRSEAAAFEALQDLAHHPLLDVVQTGPGEFPSLMFHPIYDHPYLVGVVENGAWR